MPPTRMLPPGPLSGDRAPAAEVALVVGGEAVDVGEVDCVEGGMGLCCGSRVRW